MDYEQKTVRVIVEGRVQGVWYRAWTAETAQELGLTGWVRNLRDGRVEAVFSGPEAVVNQMLDALRQGPPLAEVTRIVEGLAPDEDFSGFAVRPTA